MSKQKHKCKIPTNTSYSVSRVLSANNKQFNNQEIRTMQLAIGAILGFISVAVGAYFEHGLKAHLSTQAIESMTIALRYNQLYAILISAVALIQYSSNKLAHTIFINISQWLFISGTIIFCFSIYLATFFENKIYLSLTPFGGSIIMLAWLALILTSILIMVKHFQK